MLSINPLEFAEWIKTLVDRKKWNRFPGRELDFFWREYPDEGYTAEVLEYKKPTRSLQQVIRHYMAKVRKDEHLVAEKSGFRSSQKACAWADEAESSRAYPESSPH